MNYKNRVINEAFNLFENAIKLESFLKDEKSKELSNEDRAIMEKQLEYMKGYYECLRARIEKFLS